MSEGWTPRVGRVSTSITQAYNSFGISPGTLDGYRKPHLNAGKGALTQLQWIDRKHGNTRVKVLSQTTNQRQASWDSTASHCSWSKAPFLHSVKRGQRKQPANGTQSQRQRSSSTTTSTATTAINGGSSDSGTVEVINSVVDDVDGGNNGSSNNTAYPTAPHGDWSSLN